MFAVLLFVDRLFVDTNQVSHTSIYLLLPGSAGWNWCLKPCVFDMHPQHVGNLVLEFVLEQKKQNKTHGYFFSNAQVKCTTSSLLVASQPRATVTWKSCAVLRRKKKKSQSGLSLRWHEKSPKVWTACRDREPFGCSAQLVSFSAWIISPPHAKRWQSKCQRLKYLPREKKGAAKCSWDDGGGAASPFSLKRQRSATILSVASQGTLTHLKP